MARWMVILTLALLAGWAQAKEAVPAAEDPALEARMLRIATELRCLVCQNQTIADSHADLATDLKNQVRDQLRAGRSEQQVIDYMTQRYGDFVLYRPPFKPVTYLLWLGPLLFLSLGGTIWYMTLKKRRALKETPTDEKQLAAAAQLLDEK